MKFQWFCKGMREDEIQIDSSSACFKNENANNGDEHQNLYLKFVVKYLAV